MRFVIPKVNLCKEVPSSMSENDQDIFDFFPGNYTCYSIFYIIIFLPTLCTAGYFLFIFLREI